METIPLTNTGAIRLAKAFATNAFEKECDRVRGFGGFIKPTQTLSSGIALSKLKELGQFDILCESEIVDLACEMTRSFFDHYSNLYCQKNGIPA